MYADVRSILLLLFEFKGREQINTAENRNLVLEAAQQGLVLLKNAKPAGSSGGSGGSGRAGLPLDSATIKSLALVGPNVHNIVTHDCTHPLRQEPSYLGCEGCYCANAIDPVNPQQGFAMHMHASRINFTAGCSDITCTNDSVQWGMAEAAAAQADATVVIMVRMLFLETRGHCWGLKYLAGAKYFSPQHCPLGECRLRSNLC